MSTAALVLADSSGSLAPSVHCLSGDESVATAVLCYTADCCDGQTQVQEDTA